MEPLYTVYVDGDAAAISLVGDLDLSVVDEMRRAQDAAFDAGAACTDHCGLFRCHVL